MKKKWKSRAWGAVYGIMLFAFTAYVLLDTFVIPHAYSSAADASLSASSSQSETAASSGSTASSSSSGSAASSPSSGSTTSSSTSSSGSKTSSASTQELSSSSSSDSGATVTVTTYREYDTNIYVADITATSVEALQTALAGNTYGRNITATTSSIASANDAVLAINGDYYGARNSGYVIRDGTLYRSASAGDDQEDLVVYTDGSFEIIREGDVTAQELLDKGAWQVFSFGPGLMQDGDILVSTSSEVDRSKSSNPRTAIGEIAPLHYVLVVADGRTSESAGLSLYEMAEFLQSLGVQTAYNLDGGGSSTMYYNGSVVNQPTTNGTSIQERKVSDIVYVV